MSGWLSPAGGGSGLEAVLGHRGELQAKYQTFLEQISREDAVPARVLALMRLRIGMIHGRHVNVSEESVSADEVARLKRADFTVFSPAERAALAIAEHIPFDVHGITDAQVTEVDTHFGHRGCVVVQVAAAFFDVNCRLAGVFGLDSASLPGLEN